MAKPKPHWTFILKWIGATAVGLVLATALGPWGLALGPLFLSLGQGWVLAPHLRRIWWWTVATTLGGWLAAGASIFLVAYSPIAAGAGGAILGLAQWFVLRSQVNRAVLWIPASILGLIFGASWMVHLGLLVTVSGTSDLTPMAWLGMGFLSGAIGGTIKGVTLWWLLTRSQPSSTGKIEQQDP